MKKSLRTNLQLGAVLALSGLMAACGKLGLQGTDENGARLKMLSKSEFPASPKGERSVRIHLDLVFMADDLAVMLGCPMNACGDIKGSTLINGLGRITDRSVTPNQTSPDASIDISYASDIAGGVECLKIAREAPAKGASLDIVAVADHVEKLYTGVGVGYAEPGSTGGGSSGVEINADGSVTSKDPGETAPPAVVLTLSPNSGPDCAVTNGDLAGTTASVVVCPIPIDPKPPIGEEPSGYGVTLKSIQSCQLGPLTFEPQPQPLPVSDPEPVKLDTPQ